MYQLIHLTSLIMCFALFTCCSAAQKETVNTQNKTVFQDLISPQDSLFLAYSLNTEPSISTGTPGAGKLANGYPVPFTGKNFFYFDSVSYMHKRGFVNQKVLSTLLHSYQQLETSLPGMQFGIMECSLEHGGKIDPHRTHQNGLSVDFMTPLIKHGKQCTEYNNLGAMHYLMDFDDKGRYEKDPTASIDFEAMARHLLVLNEAAKKNNLRIEKIIWKIELQDELFATAAGKELKAQGVYVTRKLSPLINRLHDDHYHVDFTELK